MSDTNTNPASRREVWLTIALAVARDGLPEPRSVETYLQRGRGDLPFLVIVLDSHSAADAWARWLGVTEFNDKVHDQYKPPRIKRSYAWYDRAGWSWQIEGYESVSEVDASPLAEQVVAAILTPDASSLPAELVAA